jgi:membrane protein implicated in regulation of membrane protease activity
LRKKKIDGDGKTFKAPGGLVTPLIGIVAIIWLLTSLGKWEILSTLIFIAAIIVVYFVTKWLKNKIQLSKLPAETMAANKSITASGADTEQHR